MKNSHDQDVAFIDLKVDAIGEFSNKEYMGIAIPDLRFERVALDGVFGLVYMVFERIG